MKTDPCNGEKCPVRNLCQHYKDYLYQLEIMRDKPLLFNHTADGCIGFYLVEYVGG